MGSQRIDVVVELEGGVALVLQHLLLGKSQVAAHLGQVQGVFEFQDEFADAERFDARDTWFVGPQHTTAEPLAQTEAQFLGGGLDEGVVAMFQIDINEAIIRRVVER